MKKRIALVMALTVLLTSIFTFGGFTMQDVFAMPTFQRVDFVSAQVTATSLNVRQSLNVGGKVVCTLKKGQTVKVFGKLGTWYAVYEPGMQCVGVADSKYLKPIYSTTAPTPKPPVTAPKPPATVQKPPAAAPNPVTPAGVSADEQKLLTLVNNARKSAGVQALAFDMGVMKVARIKAKDMVDKNYFSHQSPTYGSPFDMLRKFGVSFKTAGENIAGNSSVDGAFKSWMNSPGHKANILNANFNYCGFGIVSGSSYGKILVQQFIGK